MSTKNFALQRSFNPRLPDLKLLRRPVPAVSSRLEAIDLARGFAIVLMILSHGIKGLLDFSQIPEWGLVPIHLVTKFSSSLFILVFGISLAVAYLPHANDADWPRRRKRLLLRGVEVFFWYKALTIVEMFHLYERPDIIKTLLYGAFPVYVEILGFYALALLWVPFTLPAWSRFKLWQRLAIPCVMLAAATYLGANSSFGGNDRLKAVLVEHESHYAWGQLSRGPLVFAGLLLGELVRWSRFSTHRRHTPVLTFLAISAACFALFLMTLPADLNAGLLAIALNEGKHPPEANFMFFSLGGAFLMLAISFFGGERLAKALAPFTLVGRNSLQSFVFHILVIFVFYRYLFDYWRSISYAHALSLTVLLIALTPLWIKTTRLVRQNS